MRDKKMNNIYLTIRTDKKIKDSLKAVSQETNESYSSYIRRLIRKNIKSDFPEIYNQSF